MKIVSDPPVGGSISSKGRAGSLKEWENDKNCGIKVKRKASKSNKRQKHVASKGA